MIVEISAEVATVCAKCLLVRPLAWSRGMRIHADSLVQPQGPFCPCAGEVPLKPPFWTVIASTNKGWWRLWGEMIRDDRPARCRRPSSS